MHTINISNLKKKNNFTNNYNSSIKMTQSNYISTIWFFFSIHWFWACWKATTLYNTLKEEPTNKNHSDDNYSALIRFWIYLPSYSRKNSSARCFLSSFFAIQRFPVGTSLRGISQKHVEPFKKTSGHVAARCHWRGITHE